MKSVLIITYYWPPAAGPGVFRWLALSKYLSRLGVKVHILTAKLSDSTYLLTDDSLKSHIHENISVHYAASPDPLRVVQFFKRKKNVGYNQINDSGVISKLMNFIRSNFFIPDPRIGWSLFARRKARKIIKQNGIKNIITTSPPHSTQLIGRSLKKKMDLNWIADFRDPWIDIFYYDQFRQVPFVKKINRRLELSILKSADTLVTVSSGLHDLFKSKYEPCQVKVVPNGFDPENFQTNSEENEYNSSKDKLIITYAGTLTDAYNPYAFFDLVALINKKSDKQIVLRFLGSLSDGLNNYLDQDHFRSHVELLGRKTHTETIEYMRKSDVLLLIIPDVRDSKGIVTGKMFEYLAIQKTILNIGPVDGDAAQILLSCRAGRTFERNEKEKLEDFLLSLLYEKDKKGKILTHDNSEEIKKYSRSFQAEEIASFLFSFEFHYL